MTVVIPQRLRLFIVEISENYFFSLKPVFIGSFMEGQHIMNAQSYNQ